MTAQQARTLFNQLIVDANSLAEQLESFQDKWNQIMDAEPEGNGVLVNEPDKTELYQKATSAISRLSNAAHNIAI